MRENIAHETEAAYSEFKGGLNYDDRRERKPEAFLFESISLLAQGASSSALRGPAEPG